ncbi:MAG: hypothetical protein KGQ93_05790 [Cyanobacteria bacterium REEB459]|nr:hypothetical protein [Cyanobacteria bacterium REEB459]
MPTLETVDRAAADLAQRERARSQQLMAQLRALGGRTDDSGLVLYQPYSDGLRPAGETEG